MKAQKKKQRYSADEALEGGVNLESVPYVLTYLWPTLQYQDR